MDQKEYFFKPWATSSHSLLLNEFERQGNNKWVLDVGCGTGYLGAVLQQRGYLIIGIDMYPLDKGFYKHYVKIIQSDIEKWTDLDNGETFDYILMADILEHVNDPEAILSKLMSLLKPAGVIIICVPNIAHLYIRMKLLFGCWDYQDYGIMDRTHLRFFTKKSLQNIVINVGIKHFKIKPVILPWQLIIPTNHKFLRGVMIFFNLIAVKIWPTMFAYQWIVSGSRYDEY
jgi:SAM-dependent methyltransferase